MPPFEIEIENIAGFGIGIITGVLLLIIVWMIHHKMSNSNAKKFDIELTEVGEQKIPVIKAVRELTGLGLREAKDLVEYAPSVILRQTDKETAKKAKKALEAEGAKVTFRNPL